MINVAFSCLVKKVGEIFYYQLVYEWEYELFESLFHTNNIIDM